MPKEQFSVDNHNQQSSLRRVVFETVGKSALIYGTYLLSIYGIYQYSLNYNAKSCDPEAGYRVLSRPGLNAIQAMHQYGINRFEVIVPTEDIKPFAERYVKNVTGVINDSEIDVKISVSPRATEIRPGSLVNEDECRYGIPYNPVGTNPSK